MGNVSFVDRKRICVVATIPFSLRMFMAPHIRALSDEYDITLVANGGPTDLEALIGEHVHFRAVPIERKISLLRDSATLFTLWRFFRESEFHCVHSITPKAGLLSMLAARLAGVPMRLHTFTGQVWATEKGLRRSLLKSMDKLLARSATKVLADSVSQQLFLIENEIVAPQEVTVLADGSVAGVDTQRFQYSAAARTRIRQQLNISGGAVVFLYLGRLNRFKGIIDLIRAFEMAAQYDSNLHLIIAGPDEENLATAVDALASRIPGRVHRVEYVNHPEQYMSAADVFCLPSYREGFGSVLIEAASIGIPAIASRIYGITDAVEDGVTGILHQPASDREIADAMTLLATDATLRHRMGRAARARVIDKFSEVRLTRAFADLYRDMFSSFQVTPK